VGQKHVSLVAVEGYASPYFGRKFGLLNWATNSVVSPIDVVAGRKRFLDDLQPMVHSWDSSSRTTQLSPRAFDSRTMYLWPQSVIGSPEVQRFDRHQLGCSVCLHPKHSKAIL